MNLDNEPLVWIDCEMTGLSLRDDALIEIAVVVTDSELVPLAPGLNFAITPPPEALEQMDDFVRNMHTKSGLLEVVASQGRPLAEVEAEVLDYVKRFAPVPRKAILAGNSVHTDKAFLDRDMPTLMEHLHYRIVDVSSVKELARRWYPKAYYAAPKKAGGHLAMADILESIDELAYYRAVLFPLEQPRTGACRRAAAAVAGTAARALEAGGPAADAAGAEARAQGAQAGAEAGEVAGSGAEGAPATGAAAVGTPEAD
ncbi:oligoribonuclease [Buchananella hordeovulneris]|nr:oligoribonuclease [Buchananella hordeovulneris]